MRMLKRIYMGWFLCGYVLIVTSTLPSWLSWANGVYLILAGITALFWLYRQVGLRQMGSYFLLCGGISLFSEWFGVHTGLWFGTYAYTEQFAPFLFGVPVAIPFAWCMIILLSRWIVPNQRFSGIAVAALCAVAIDVLLDPVAVVQAYWLWETAGVLSFYEVPWTNFASWWITSFVILLLTNRYLPTHLFMDNQEYPLSYSVGSNVRRVTWWSLLQTIWHQPLLLILVTLEMLFITIAIQHALWFAVLINLLLLGILLVCRKYWHPLHRRSEP